MDDKKSITQLPKIVRKMLLPSVRTMKQDVSYSKKAKCTEFMKSIDFTPKEINSMCCIELHYKQLQCFVCAACRVAVHNRTMNIFGEKSQQKEKEGLNGEIDSNVQGRSRLWKFTISA